MSMSKDQFIARLVVLVPNLTIEKAIARTNLACSENCIEHLINTVHHMSDGNVSTLTRIRINMLLSKFLVPANMETKQALYCLISWYNQSRDNMADSPRWYEDDRSVWRLCQSLADLGLHGSISTKMLVNLQVRIAELLK